MSMLETRIEHCPYCGEAIELVLDTSVAEQEYVEDCFVCCRPILIHLQVDGEGDVQLTLRAENE